MSFEDLATYAGAALLVAAIIYVPKRVSARQRLRLGAVLFVVGWAGVLLTLVFDDFPMLQSDVVAYTLMGSFAAAIVVSILFLVTAFFDWFGMTRPRRQRFQFPPYR